MVNVFSKAFKKELELRRKVFLQNYFIVNNYYPELDTSITVLLWYRSRGLFLKDEHFT